MTALVIARRVGADKGWRMDGGTGPEGVTLMGVILAKAYLVLAALAGSATGAWFLRPKTRLEWLATVLGGFFASIFVAPYLVAKWFPHATGSSPEVAMTYYACSIVAMFVIPGLIRRVVKRYTEEPAQP